MTGRIVPDVEGDLDSSIVEFHRKVMLISVVENDTGTVFTVISQNVCLLVTGPQCKADISSVDFPWFKRRVRVVFLK